MLSLPPILCFHSLWIGKEESNNYAALQCKIINWPHSKWRPSGFYGFENMGVVLDSVYSSLVATDHESTQLLYFLCLEIVTAWVFKIFEKSFHQNFLATLIASYINMH